MRAVRLALVLAVLGAFAPLSSAVAGDLRVSVDFGNPSPWGHRPMGPHGWGPHERPYPHHWAPPPVYARPAPVYYRPAPVIYRPSPVVYVEPAPQISYAAPVGLAIDANSGSTPYTDRYGRLCRSFQGVTPTAYGYQNTSGKACLASDGTWRVSTI